MASTAHLRIFACVTLIALTCSQNLFAGAQTATAMAPDYTKYDHHLIIKSFRSGSHDADDGNDYTLSVNLIAFSNRKSEAAKDFKERVKIEKKLGYFGNYQLANLTYLTIDPKTELEGTNAFEVKGNDIRLLIAKLMREQKLMESEVALRAEILLSEKDKKFYFFGEDKTIGNATYYPVPPNDYQTPPRTDQMVEVRDEQGTLVQIQVKYKTPNVKVLATSPDSGATVQTAAKVH